ncbi:MAG: hypothetical protein U0807_04995 [Candidatus Binatia bacterium]
MAVLWLAMAGATPGRAQVEQLKSQLEALASFTADLDRRLASGGLQGLDGALDVYKRVQEALGQFSAADLEGMLAEVATLEHELAKVNQALERIRQLKALLRA